MNRRLAIPIAAALLVLPLAACKPAPTPKINQPAPATTSPPATAPPGTVRSLTFPVSGTVRFTDTFGAPRSNGRTHQGADLMGTKMQPLLAAATGKVTRLTHTNTGTAGNWLIITDAEGWQYWYMHINNDTPGTDDGANAFEQAFVPGLTVGSQVTAGQHIAYLGDSGNAEGTSPHLHFELRDPVGNVVNPYPSLAAAR